MMMSPERAEKLSVRADKLFAIGWILLLTAVVLILSRQFGFPWIAGIGVQVLCLAAIVGGFLLYGKVKARKSAERYDKKAGIVSCMMVALFLGPAVLNAAEVSTWTRATADSEPSSVFLTYAPVCAANDGGTGSGAMSDFAGLPAHSLGAAPQLSALLSCVEAALVGLALAALCLATILSVTAAAAAATAGASAAIGLVGWLKIGGACLLGLAAIAGAIANCFTSGDATQSEEWGGRRDEVKPTDALLPLPG